MLASQQTNTRHTIAITVHQLLYYHELNFGLGNLNINVISLVTFKEELTGIAV